MALWSAAAATYLGWLNPYAMASSKLVGSFFGWAFFLYALGRVVCVAMVVDRAVGPLAAVG